MRLFRDLNKQFQIYRVVDGDAIYLDIPDADRPYTPVRLWGADTPETKAPGKPLGYFGPEATAFTEKMLASGRVTIELEKKIYEESLADSWDLSIPPMGKCSTSSCCEPDTLTRTAVGGTAFIFASRRLKSRPEKTNGACG